jgi:hypothetical protein
VFTTLDFPIILDGQIPNNYTNYITLIPNTAIFAFSNQHVAFQGLNSEASESCHCHTNSKEWYQI